jgi:hypothetical protein
MMDITQFAWYEDLADFQTRLDAMTNDELDSEIESLNRRVLELEAKKRQHIINKILAELDDGKQVAGTRNNYRAGEQC